MCVYIVYIFLFFEKKKMTQEDNDQNIINKILKNPIKLVEILHYYIKFVYYDTLHLGDTYIDKKIIQPSIQFVKEKYKSNIKKN